MFTGVVVRPQARPPLRAEFVERMIPIPLSGYPLIKREPSRQSPSSPRRLFFMSSHKKSPHFTSRCCLRAIAPTPFALGPGWDAGWKFPFLSSCGGGRDGLGVRLAGRAYLCRPYAPVAQLDRVLPSEGRGHRFESCRVRQLPPFLEHRFLSATAGHLRRGACPLPGSPNRPVRTPPRGTRPRPARLA